MKGRKKDLPARLISWALLPFSFVYGLGVFCHRQFYCLRGVYKAPKPVISIGNLTVGGSGKTPLVVILARYFHEKGLRPNILTRGYMPQALQDSDEVYMLNEQIPFVPVLAGGDRVANIKKNQGALPVDVYIADDAFQHWPLGRDLDIVTIDAGNPFGNGYLLPAGTLREPLSALKRANVIVLTKTKVSGNTQALSSKLKGINPEALIVESHYKSAGLIDVFSSEALPGDALKGKNVIGFCAIGDPASFETSLKDTGARILGFLSYLDHHAYQKEDIQHIMEACRSKEAGILVTTHKDAVKLKGFKEEFKGVRLIYLPIQLEVTKGADEFYQKVIAVCRH